MAVLHRRDTTCYNRWGDRVSCNNYWHDWGRWVALAVIIGAALLFFFAFACISSRRRRRQGMRPFYGTGWAAQGTQQQQGPPYYGQPYPGAPPPQYSQNHGYYAPPPQANGQPGYFGGQQTGVELQQPQNAYRGGDIVYPPPAGSPPPKQ